MTKQYLQNLKYMLPEDGRSSRQGLEITVVLHLWYPMNQFLYGKPEVFP